MDVRSRKWLKLKLASLLATSELVLSTECVFCNLVLMYNGSTASFSPTRSALFFLCSAPLAACSVRSVPTGSVKRTPNSAVRVTRRVEQKPNADPVCNCQRSWTLVLPWKSTQVCMHVLWNDYDYDDYSVYATGYSSKPPRPSRTQPMLPESAVATTRVRSPCLRCMSTERGCGASAVDDRPRKSSSQWDTAALQTSAYDWAGRSEANLELTGPTGSCCCCRC